MKRTILLGTLTAALLAPFAAAHAYSNVSVSVNTPEFGIRIGGPVYGPVYAPVPVYAPAPIYAPVPVYAPRPVYVTPRVVYPAPVIVAPARYYAPRHFGPPARVWVAPHPHQHRGWSDRRDGRGEHRRDRDDYRAGYRY